MFPRERIIIGTRDSVLALKQTDIVAQALKTVDSSVTVDVRVIQTHGDINHQPIPLDAVGKGWFTKEIENALLHKIIDIAVHSLKDMTDEMPSGLAIGAYLPRKDARDALITKHGESLEDLPPGAIIGTDSARRQAQMLALRPDTRMRSLRGNVPTRLQKLYEGDYNAVILAAAGLERLGLERKIIRYFDPTEMTPAPGQGILAAQCRENDAVLLDLLARVTDPDTTRAAHVERSFSHRIGGGCKAPTGAYAFRKGHECRCIGMIVGTRGHIFRKEMRVPWNESERLGEDLAEALLTERSYEEEHT